MKKAFTLIELLVVIAIIAILAAILFPVFAQAKMAAKKTVSISNVKQIGTGVLLYMGDNDDVYPRNDDCFAQGSLNPAHYGLAFNPTGVGCTSSPFYNRVNHYKWQKWLQPYTKSVELFFHPVMKKAEPNWSQAGEIMNGYALNLALTGALNTYNRPTGNGRFRNSFLGGTQNNIPDVASAMLFTEFPSTSINYLPVFVTPSAETQTAYPAAVRELWKPIFMKRIGSTGCTYSDTEVDPMAAPFASQITIGRADGSAKTMNVREFLSKTPSAAEYQVSSRWPCAPDGGSWTISAAPTWSGKWPMWALD